MNKQDTQLIATQLNAETKVGVGAGAPDRGPQGPGSHGFQEYGLSILRIRYLVPRMFVCAVFSCLAILRIGGSLNSTL